GSVKTVHALELGKVPIHTVSGIVDLIHQDNGEGVAVSILMGLIIALKRLDGSRKLIPVLTGYLASTTGGAYAAIIQICHICHCYALLMSHRNALYSGHMVLASPIWGVKRLAISPVA